MKRSTTFLLFTFLSVALLAGQPNQQVLDYIEQYKAIAVQEMIDYKIPASITMAQGILESGAGNSELAKQSNNHFGIKCHTDWTGEKVYYDDDEKGECFRKYDEVAQSYRDHSIFLSTKPRYASLFELQPDDYKGWAKGLKAAGYATNPKYADLLINLIEEYNLQELDKMTMADIKKSNKKDDHKKPDEHKNDTVKKDDHPATASNDKEEKTTDRRFNWGGYDEDVFYYNRIPAIKVKDGETPESIAKKHHVKISLLRDYNDIEDGRGLDVGSNCYLQPKRKKGDEKYHIVKSGETMWTISRDEGVRLGYLYKYNRIEAGMEPAVGEKVYLRSKRSDVMKLSSPTTKSTIKSSPPPAPEKVTPTPEKKPEAEAPKKEEYKDTNNDIYIDFEEETTAPVKQAVTQDSVKTSSVKSDQIKSEPVAKPVEIKVVPEVQSEAPILSEQYHDVQPKETLYGISKMYGVTVEQLQQWNHLDGNNIQIGQKLIVGYK